MSTQFEIAMAENNSLKEENLHLQRQLDISAIPSKTLDQTSEAEIIKDPARKDGRLKPSELPYYDGNRMKL